MTVTQTVTIPADHRVLFEFLAPRDIPAGKARAEVKLTPVVEEVAEQEPPYPQSEDQEPASKFDKRIKEWAKWYPPETLERFSNMSPRLKALSGIIADAGDITYEQIREERLAEKYGV